MAGSGTRAVTGQRSVSRFYRRPPGFGWLLALAAIPLLLAAIGYGPLKVSKPDIEGPGLAAPNVSLPSGPSLEVPSGEVPTVEVPGVAVPTVEVPGVAVPSAEAPAAPTTEVAPSPTERTAAADGSCENLQDVVSGLLSSPITFVTDGFTLSAQSQQQLARVAEKIVGCPDARIAVNGYTDNTGNDGINVPLSRNRAKSVADYLVSNGVAADHVTANGFGSADPVAANNTSEGRAQNRRVVIVVS